MERAYDENTGLFGHNAGRLNDATVFFVFFLIRTMSQTALHGGSDIMLWDGLAGALHRLGYIMKQTVINVTSAQRLKNKKQASSTELLGWPS